MNEESLLRAEDSAPQREGIARLCAGYRRFVCGHSRARRPGVDYLRLLEAPQSPQITVVSCSDSRVPPEVLFDALPGELFVLRVPGLAMSEVALETLEAGLAFGTRVVLFLAHQNCAAVANVQKYFRAEMQELTLLPTSTRLLARGFTERCPRDPLEAIRRSCEHSIATARESLTLLRSLQERTELVLLSGMVTSERLTVERLCS